MSVPPADGHDEVGGVPPRTGGPTVPTPVAYGGPLAEEARALSAEGGLTDHLERLR